MDLNDINLEESADKGAELNLEHPVSGEKLGIKILLSGTDSKAYRAKQRDIQNRRLTKMARGRKVDFSKSEVDECELLAACTLGWSGLAENGKEIKFSTSEAETLYSKHGWIKEQVDEFIGDRSNFFTVA